MAGHFSFWGVTLEPSTTQYQNFKSHSSELHQFKNTTVVTTTNGSSRNNNSNNSANSVFSNAAQSSVNLVPDPVFAQWKPSERVLALTPEQVLLSSLRLVLYSLRKLLDYCCR